MELSEGLNGLRLAPKAFRSVSEAFTPFAEY
jgi:hypothetical protein